MGLTGLLLKKSQLFQWHHVKHSYTVLYLCVNGPYTELQPYCKLSLKTWYVLGPTIFKA